LKIEGDGDLVIEDVQDDDEGKYQCLAKNLVGTRSTDKVDLSIQGDYIMYFEHTGSLWQLAMASGWESEGPGFKPQRPRQPLIPGCQKNSKKIFPALKCAYND